MMRKREASPATPVSPRRWAPPQVRRLATSGAESGASSGFDADETPS